MSREQKFSDEFLNAFVDGELAPEDKNSVYVEIRRDESLNRRVCELRNLRELVRFAYAEPPCPAQMPSRRRALARAGLGLAASLTVIAGALIGWGLHRTSDQHLRSDMMLPVPAAVSEEPVKVLIHLSNGQPTHIQQTLDDIEGLIQFYRRQHQPARIEVIVNGDGLNMLRADTSPFPARITRMQKEYDNLTFAACQNTIDRLKREHGITARLLPGVVVIDSGVAQIMRRQHQGWAYIRV